VGHRSPRVDQQPDTSPAQAAARPRIGHDCGSRGGSWDCLSPYSSTVCTHHVDTAPADAPLRCCVMGGGTPIYDQVRGERINADVPPSAATPQRVDDHGRHRVRPDTPVSAAVFGPPGPGADQALSHHCRAGTYPAGLPTADGPPQATTGEPQAALPPQVHTRQAPRHAANNPPACVADRNPAGREATAGDRGATATPTSAHHVALTSTLFSRR
jgi:hypothetical protein